MESFSAISNTEKAPGAFRSQALSLYYSDQSSMVFKSFSFVGVSNLEIVC